MTSKGQIRCILVAQDSILTHTSKTCETPRNQLKISLPFLFFTNESSVSTLRISQAFSVLLALQRSPFLDYFLLSSLILSRTGTPKILKTGKWGTHNELK